MSLCKWEHIRTGVTLFLPTFALLLAVNWPAITGPWFALDDYYLITAGWQEMAQLYVTQGRPMYLLLVASMAKAAFSFLPSLEAASIFLHSAQAAAHTLTAVMIGLAMVHRTQRRVAYLAMVPFLLWPMNETTLWISAAGYPVGGLLSVAGVLLIDGREAGRFKKLLGTLLIIAATLTIQTASLVGLSLFVIQILLLHREDITPLTRRVLPWVAAGYLAGGAATGLLSVLLHSYRVVNASFFSWLAARTLFVHSWQFLVAPPNISAWIGTLHMILVGLGAGATVIALLIRPRTPGTFLRISVVLLAMVSLFIIPGIPLYALGKLITTPRVFYAGPLVFTGALCLLLTPALPRTLFTGIFLLFVSLLLIGYVPISSVSAEEHVTTYRRDLERLRMLERAAESDGVSTIVISNLPERLTTPNPYHHRYYSGESKKSAFGFAWSSIPMIGVFSGSLKVIHDKHVTALCTEYCTSAPFDPTIVEDSLRLTVLRTSRMPFLCYCP